MTAAAIPLSQPHSSPANARGADSKSAEQRAHEPSMEEILASIRRIIADDTGAAKSRKASLTGAPAVAPLVIVAPAVETELPVAGHPPAEPAKQETVAQVQGASPVQDTVADAEPVTVAPATQPQLLAADTFAQAAAMPATPDEADDVLDLAEQADLNEAFAFLSPGAPDHGSPQLSAFHHVAGMDATDMPPQPSSQTDSLTSPKTDAAVSASFQSLAETVFLNNTAMIEQMTREMLRPMLKTWLDDNLPVMVERLVRTEIERVARGGR